MKEESKKINVDRAWDRLYSRLETDHLLTAGNYRRAAVRRFMKYAAVLLIILAGGIGGFYLTGGKKAAEELTLNNSEGNTTLVTTLTDGSTVYLTQGASLTYPRDFEASQREVSLTGKALFLVKGNKECPFVIETSSAVVKVTGTAFDIKSLPGKADNFELNVQEGTVEVTSRTRHDRITVGAGESIRLQDGRWQKTSGAAPNLFDTYSRRMRFKDETLDNLLSAVNKTGIHPALLASPDIRHRKITVAFDNTSPRSMAELICLALNLQQTATPDTIYISQP